jgi:hypothetical protein
MKHAALIARLCEASEGTPELSAEVWTALTGVEHRVARLTTSSDTIYRYIEDEPMGWVPCLTTSLSAAWEEAERRGHRVINVELCAYAAPHYSVILDDLKTRQRRMMIGSQTGALALCAAILAAEGER